MSARAEAPSDARAGRLVTGLRLCCLVALACSSAAAIERYGAVHAFCAQGSGCDAVQRSGLGQSLGVALPALGLLGFALVLAATLAQRPSARLFAVAAAISSGVAGATLLLLQGLVIGAFCRVCVGADAAALGAGLFALPLLRGRERWPAPRAGSRALWGAALLLAAGIPAAFARATPAPPLPAYVRAASVAGKLNVVEVSDFECPYCRAMHPALMRALAPYRDRVNFVRITFPLPLHRHAREAAHAYLCAQDQGHGEAMADRLFAAPDLSAPATQRYAAALGLDAAAFARCLGDPATDARIERQMAAVRRAGFRGLPLVFIGTRSLLGFDASRGSQPYADALAQADNRAGAPSRWAPWALLAALEALLVVPALRARARETASAQREA